MDFNFYVLFLSLFSLIFSCICPHKCLFVVVVAFSFLPLINFWSKWILSSRSSRWIIFVEFSFWLLSFQYFLNEFIQNIEIFIVCSLFFFKDLLFSFYITIFFSNNFLLRFCFFNLNNNFLLFLLLFFLVDIKIETIEKIGFLRSEKLIFNDERNNKNKNKMK